ncbi:MAG: hypothetical protein U0Q55_04330 [Vicinamibacterales bacterium]
MLTELLFWLPDEAAVFVIVGVGFALMVGLMSPGAALRTLGLFCLFLILTPFIDALVGQLPTLWLIPLGLFVATSMFRSLANLTLGERAADHMVGSLAASAMQGAFALLLLPFRLLFGAVRWALFGAR